MTTDPHHLEHEPPSPGVAPHEEASGTLPPPLRKRRHLFLPDLARNLWGGIKLSLFLRVQPEQFAATPVALAVLALADFIVSLFTSVFLSGSSGTFSFSSFPYFYFHLPFMLLGGLVLSKLLSRPELLRELPVALISLSIPVELYHCALEELSRLSFLHWLQDYLQVSDYYRFFWWWCCAALVFLLRIAGRPFPRRLAALPLFLLLVVLPLWAFPRGDLWVSGNGESEGGELHLTDEVLAAQSRILDRDLASIKAGRRGIPDLYFVGFAGDASQDVFTREISAVEQLFVTRFGTAGRSIILANNPQTATTLPFATAANLERTLARVGELMNRDEDVLFLFLTSHGSPDHVLAVDNPPLELDGLTPEMLRRMLKKSGIKWKVLVISACYSGGFIDPLKDEHTLIMTAADATHESFGCGYGEKFTWFGEALLNEALRTTYSFPKAFEKARGTIRQWEREQGETPSNPQVYLGTGMGKKLDRLEESLAARGKRGGERGSLPAGHEEVQEAPVQPQPQPQPQSRAVDPEGA